MKNKHLFRPAPRDAVLPNYLFNLPEDIHMLREVAFAEGILNAFIAWKREPHQMGESFVRALAIEKALFFEKKQAGDGSKRKGANDPVAFREEFSTVCARVHTAVTHYFESHPSVFPFLARLPESKLVEQAYKTAHHMIDDFEHLAPDAPLHLEF